MTEGSKHRQIDRNMDGVWPSCTDNTTLIFTVFLRWKKHVTLCDTQSCAGFFKASFTLAAKGPIKCCTCSEMLSGQQSVKLTSCCGSTELGLPKNLVYHLGPYTLHPASHTVVVLCAWWGGLLARSEAFRHFLAQLKKAATSKAVH